MFGLAGCANTIDPNVRSGDDTVAPTTTLPTGSTPELLERLAVDAVGLSTRIVDNDDDRQALAGLQQLWAAARPQVLADDPGAAGKIDAAMTMMNTAVERNRPADADKGARNLRVVIDAYLGDGATGGTTSPTTAA